MPCHTTLPQTIPLSPSSPLPPRIQTLLASLSIVKHSLSARLLLHYLILHRGRYCLACHRRGTRGLCTRTCALRGPFDHGCVNISRDDMMARAATLRNDFATYARVLRGMYASRGRVSRYMMARWEEEVRALVRGCETPTEMLEREGWVRVMERGEGDKEISFGEWEFEGAWRKGRGRVGEDAVPPEVVVGMKGEKRKSKTKARSI